MVEQSFPVFLMNDFNLIRRKEDIGHVVVVKNVAILKRSPLLQDSVNDRDGG